MLQEKIFKIFVDLWFNMPSIVHPNNFVSPHKILGNDCMVVKTVVGLGKNATINAGTSFKHYAVVNDFDHFKVKASKTKSDAT